MSASDGSGRRVTGRPARTGGPSPAPRILAGGRELPPGRDRYLVGRGPEADVRVDSPLVSREHGLIERSGDGWRFRDTASRNGTFVDGRRAPTVPLTGRAILRLGAADGPELVVELVAAGPAPIDRAAGGRVETGATALGRLSVIHEVRSTVVTIGRDPGNDLVIDDLRASRRHARLLLAPGQAPTIEDLGSQNGTFVNGREVASSRLADGDLVGIGSVTFRYAAGRLEEYRAEGAAWLAAVDLGVTVGGGRRLLDGVSFALEPSSVLAVVGPSGAGKTTLLNALTGFRPADRGAVLYGGRDVYAAYGELRSRMGFVPQDDILHPQLTVRQALSYAAELRFPADVSAATRRARVDEVIAELGLTERADLRIGRLSGGQRKRTSVGVELLTRPSLLFLDEPTSGLDPANEASLMVLLGELARGGRTVVVVTHSIASLTRADRVLFLAPGGRTAFYGAPGEIEEYFDARGVPGTVDEVFRVLDTDRRHDWQALYASDPLHERYVRTPLEKAGPARPAAVAPPPPPPPPTGWGRQLSVLVRRYLAVTAADRGVLALLLLQGPIFGLFFLALFSGNVFSTLYALEAGVLIWLLALGATWLGTSNGIREIVKELPIHRRERAIGLSNSAYLASKLLVLGAITTVQTVVLVLIAMQRHRLPPEDGGSYDSLLGAIPPGRGPEIPTVSFDAVGALLGDPFVELVLGAVLTGLGALSIALAVSALVRSSDRASTALPILLIAQTVVSAPLFGTPGAVLGTIGNASTTQWGVAAMAATADLNQVRSPFIEIQSYVRATSSGSAYRPGYGVRQAWTHDAETWRGNVAALLLLALLGIAVALVALRLLDPNGAGRRRRWPPGREAR